MKVRIFETGEEKNLSIYDRNGIDYAKDFIIDNVSNGTSQENYEFWKKAINKEQAVQNTINALSYKMAEYVRDAIAHLYLTDIDNYPDLVQVKNAIAFKLYEDLDCEKTEGFAQFCHYTAIEVLDGKFDSFEEIQTELSLILEEAE